MAASKTALACGGKGPCCHIGYSHRHCGHCDTVISLVQFNWYPYSHPTVAPTYPTWRSGTAAQQMPPNATVYAMNGADLSRTQTVGMLPESHACEAKS